MFALMAGLKLWANNPVLGGKTATGHGLVQAAFDDGMFVSPADNNVPDDALDAYTAHLRANAGDIERLLNEATAG
jgi:hypothetical protein